MAKTGQLARLFSAISSRDWDRMKTAANAICDDEEEKGHATAARLLRGALHANGSVAGSVPPTRSGTESVFSATGALARVTYLVSLGEVELRRNWRRELEEVITEWKCRDRLEMRNLKPRNRLLFHGPPGCGKSLAAVALGTELSLPTYVVRFDAVIGAYLGQTAIHLRQLFSYAESHACVLILDELDALGKKRGNPLDVGELDRIVIALMQELEHTQPLGVIVATSNLPQHLDDALWRRFDLVVEFPTPSQAELSRYAKRLSKVLAVTFDATLRKKLANAKCYADAKKLIESQARKNAILEE